MSRKTDRDRPAKRGPALYEAKPVTTTWLAKRLAFLRRAAGCTRYELAQLAGVSPSTISRIECDGGDPHLSVVLLLAGGLGVSLDAFDPRVVHCDGRPLDS